MIDFTDKKILMVFPERLGDTLMTTPALHYLKYYYPSCQIDALCLSDLSAETLKNNPDINELFLHKKNSDNTLYHYGINIHDDPTNRITRDIFAEFNIQPFNIPDPDATLHQTEQALLFMQRVLPDNPPILNAHRHYQIYPDYDDFEFIKNLLKTHDINSNTILIACHLGCHSIAKRGYKLWRKPQHPKVWPLEFVIELTKKINTTHPHIRFIITGSKSEEVLGKKLMKQCPDNINLINKVSVLQLSALMQKYLKLFITPDTGVMHLACASQVPLLALFGPTSLKRTSPYPECNTHYSHLLQAPKMSDISVDTVYNQILTILELSR